MTFTTRRKLANITLFMLTLTSLILLGGGNYETLNITRVIASDPPRSLAMLQGPYRFFPVPFWALFHPLSILFLILSLIFNWNISLYRRKLLLIVAGAMLLLTLATQLYFAPETGVIANAPYSDTVDEVLKSRAQRWVNLNYIRLAVDYGIAVILLLAVNRNIVSPE
ncbi:MAG TPA: hypothetical protein VGK59_20495 [Ohtaekwangia sp.]